jgi:tripartite ATP-independent transporter DctP family solute receptor
MRTILAALLALMLLATACGGDDGGEVGQDGDVGDVAQETDGGEATDDGVEQDADDEAVSATDEDCGEHSVQHSFIAAEGSTWDRAAERWAERVSEGSDGRIDIQRFPGAQLAGANQQAELEQVQDGVIDSLWVSPIILALFMDRRFDIYSLPFLFPDHETANEVIDGPVGEMTEEWVREGGLEPLGWGVNGFRQLTNDERPVRAPEDMQGMQIRVAGTDLFLETFRLMGADPVTMNFGEVFTSLQQGVIDGQENPLSIIDSSSLDEVQGHLSMWNYSYDPLVLAMNADKFDEFCSSDQELLREAAREATEYFRELAIQEDEELPAELAERGMEIIPYEEVEVEEFQELVQEPIYEQWRPVIGEEAVDMMLDAVEEAQSS